jgi:hypothetical protein
VVISVLSLQLRLFLSFHLALVLYIIYPGWSHPDRVILPLRSLYFLVISALRSSSHFHVSNFHSIFSFLLSILSQKCSQPPTIIRSQTSISFGSLVLSIPSCILCIISPKRSAVSNHTEVLSWLLYVYIRVPATCLTSGPRRHELDMMPVIIKG